MSWTSISMLEKIPYIAAGGFGAYCGYTLAESKAALASGFQKYQQLRPGEADPISTNLFGLQTTVSQQLHAFTTSVTAELHHFPDAFVELQERAFAPTWERTTEAQHVMIKSGSTRGFRHTKPARANANFRKRCVLKMLDDPRKLEFAIHQWNCHTLDQRLLAHICSKDALRQMSYSERLARIYGYSAKDHFSDLTTERQQTDALALVCREAQPQPALAITQQMRLVFNYSKNRLGHASIFLCPQSCSSLQRPRCSTLHLTPSETRPLFISCSPASLVL